VATGFTGKLTAIAVVALLVGMGVVVAVLFTGDTPSPVCDHVRKLRDGDEIVDLIVARAPKAKGDTPDARCRSAWRILDETLEEREATRLLDCLVHVTDARAARACMP
jgi:hypothetical protein